MALRSFEIRELFHLALLRHLAARLSGRSYSVKGGGCLRFFHRSPRLSQDMDLDVVSSLRVETLRNAVDSVIDGRAMLATLMPAGVSRLSATKPKQTDTTQRWKVLLEVGDERLSTKVEFSRRRDRVEFSTGIPDAELLRRHKMTPFAAQFYDKASMAAQKIGALASPKRNALRDLFDLHHVFFTLGCRPADVLPLVDEGMPAAAAEKVLGFGFADFREQVVPYLAADMIDLYRSPAVFEQQKEAVAGILLELAR